MSTCHISQRQPSCMRHIVRPLWTQNLNINTPLFQGLFQTTTETFLFSKPCLFKNYMAQVIARIPLNYRGFEEDVGFSDDPAYFTDIVFGSWEEQEVSHESLCTSGDYNEDDDDDEISPCNVEENNKFWETQIQLLQVNFHFLFNLQCAQGTLRSL